MKTNELARSIKLAGWPAAKLPSASSEINYCKPFEYRGGMRFPRVLKPWSVPQGGAQESVPEGLVAPSGHAQRPARPGYQNGMPGGPRSNLGAIQILIFAGRVFL